MKPLEIVVRPATPDDVTLLARLMTELGYPTSAEAMGARLRTIDRAPDYATFVAESDGRVIGMIGLCMALHYARDGCAGRIVALSVLEQHRRLGVGASLVRRGERWVREHGGSRVIVNTHTRRADAHAFYEGLGYEETGLRFVKPLELPV